MSKISVKVGDITQEKACAIVNAANSSLLGGGGVDGAIHRAAGKALDEACRQVRADQFPHGLPTGNAVATTAGNLPSNYVIHTVGPIYVQCANKCALLLASCYRHALTEALKLGCKDIVFPAISTGIYGFPKEEAAAIAFKTVQEFLQEAAIDVTFIFHSAADAALFQKVTRQHPVEDTLASRKP